jgi:hypothetical protein
LYACDGELINANLHLHDGDTTLQYVENAQKGAMSLDAYVSPSNSGG